MVDDPLSFLGVAVWLMAAGMYPVGVGYMFGVCSACCDDCPEECSKCTHWHNTGGLCNRDPLTENWLSTRTFSIDVEGIGTGVRTNAPLEPVEKDGIGSVQIPPEMLPALPAGWETNFRDSFVYAEDFEEPPVLDNCGCAKCGFGIGIKINFGVNIGFGPNDSVVGSDEDVIFGRYFFGTLDECDQTEVNMLPQGEWAEDIVGFPFIDADLLQALRDLVDSLEISVTLSEFEPCDCGACCDDGCEENVAEGGCDSWQGVGVGCDPDPCE